jgi:hypothetical protein
MPRIIRRPPCDCDTCTTPEDRGGISNTRDALARQEPPPKSLIVVLDGAVCSTAPQGDGPTSLDLSQCSHLDNVARDGSCGLLACVAESSVSSPLLRQLFKCPAGEQSSLGHRFKELRCCIRTPIHPGYDEPPDGDQRDKMWQATGCRICPIEVAIAASENQKNCGEGIFAVPRIDATKLAQQVLDDLSVQPLEEYVAQADAECTTGATSAASTGQGVETKQTMDMDMVLVHARDISNSHGDAPEWNVEVARAALEWLDEFIRYLDTQPGFRDTVLLTLILGSTENLPSALSLHSRCSTQPESGMRNNDDGSAKGVWPNGFCKPVPKIRPMQTFQFSGANKVDVDLQRCALIVHRLEGVIRRDRVTSLDAAAVSQRGGGGCILVERVLPEIAYKLGRAGKYGA